VSGFLGVYEVVGKRSYREHKPGSRFEARLDRAAEARAVARGSIRLLERIAEDLPPDKYRLPTGWPGATERTD
jgi:hypothetical protein